MIGSADDPESPTRAMCWRCRRPRSVCYCGAVTPAATRSRVVILQHPRERDVPIGTARIAELCLSNAEVLVGVNFGENARLGELLGSTEQPPILLYPSAHSRDLGTSPPEGPVTLIVIDGTWWQASKVFKQNPLLATLPRYALAPRMGSRYRIRREPAEHCLSTIEAVAAALSILEGTEFGPAALLAPFEEMVETQLRFARQGQMPRHRKLPRVRPQARVPQVLRERPGDVVVVYGEANAWPYGTVGAPEPELVHIAAERLMTGERFEAYVAPRGALAPGLVKHTGLSVERVLGGEDAAGFAERWRTFLGRDALLAGWGFFSSEFVCRLSGHVPERLDVRGAAIHYLGKRVGEMDDYARVLDACARATWAEGRTGRRLAVIAGILDRLVAAAHGDSAGLGAATLAL
jgi:DTW domain-containing protein